MADLILVLTEGCFKCVFFFKLRVYLGLCDEEDCYHDKIELSLDNVKTHVQRKKMRRETDIGNVKEGHRQ